MGAKKVWAETGVGAAKCQWESWEWSTRGEIFSTTSKHQCFRLCVCFFDYQSI